MLPIYVCFKDVGFSLFMLDYMIVECFVILTDVELFIVSILFYNFFTFSK